MRANKTHLTVNEFYPRWLVACEKGEVCTLIDVRTPEEYANGHVPTAKLMPLNTLHGVTDEIAQGETVYLICQGGVRSILAMKHLREQGLSKLVTIVGGTTAWIDSGYPIEQENDPCVERTDQMAAADCKGTGV